MSRLYIAGPMTGLPDFNYPAFRSAATTLSELGYQVEDPSTNVNPTPGDYHGWLRAGLAQLIRCDGVALLDGWEASGGARLEVNVAATLGMRVRPLQEWVSA
nr:MAG TPA: Nucleoside 2-deoxyribosyltransferase like protein [Caudoviricetes sp.]